MNQITTVPQSVSGAGYTFNYALWTAGTVVTLVNVPWDSSYRNIVKFSSAQGMDDWIDSRTNKLVVGQLKHNRLNAPVKIDAPFERVVGYNYIRATNPSQPVSGSLPSTYYYFIKTVDYGAPNTTIINVQLDVWTTFNMGVSFGRCYLERGHMGLANSRRNEENGRRYLTVPEGLDVGGEMEIAHVFEKSIASARSNDPDTVNYSVMVTSSVDLTSTGGSVDDAMIVTADGTPMENLPNGGGIYIFRNPKYLRQFLAHNKEKAWVTQSITAITAIPPFETVAIPVDPISLDGVDSGGVYVPKGGTIPQVTQQVTPDWTAGLGLPTRYQNLDKFKVYPYTIIELTAFTGQPLVLKPESLASRSIDTNVIYHLNPGSGKVSVVPARYNAAQNGNTITDSVGIKHDGGEWLDFATGIQNFPSFTTVNSSSSAYLASNRNSIAFQHKSASWEQARAMAGANTAYGQAASGMGLTEAMNAAGIQQRNAGTAQTNQTRGHQGVVGMAQGFVGALGQAPTSPVGAITGAVSSMGGAFANTLIDQNQNTQMTSINNAYANQATGAQLANQGYNRDTNLDLASFSAQGDYANAIAGIQAKVQDAAMLQPTTSGQIGGDAFLLASIGWSIFAMVKRPQGTAMTELGEYWLRYGYRVNRWVTPPPSLLACAKFTYWQMKDANVFSESAPEEYRQTIRGIFETGVTVYSNPDDIGRLDPADNAPVGGISF